MQDSEECHHSIPIIVRALIVPDWQQGVKKDFSYHLSKFPLGGWLTTIQGVRLVSIFAPSVFLNWRCTSLLVSHNHWFKLAALRVTHMTSIDFIRHRARVLVLLHLIKSEFPIFGNCYWPHLVFHYASKSIKAEQSTSRVMGFSGIFRRITSLIRAKEKCILIVKLLLCHCHLYNQILYILRCY